MKFKEFLDESEYKMGDKRPRNKKKYLKMLKKKLPHLSDKDIELMFDELNKADPLYESTISTAIDSYDVPYADKKKKGYYRTDIPPAKRNKLNIPLDKMKKPKVNIEDWLKIKDK